MVSLEGTPKPLILSGWGLSEDWEKALWWREYYWWAARRGIGAGFIRKESWCIECKTRDCVYENDGSAFCPYYSDMDGFQDAASVTFAQMISASDAIKSGVPGEAKAREAPNKNGLDCRKAWICSNLSDQAAPCPLDDPQYIPHFGPHQLPPLTKPLTVPGLPIVSSDVPALVSGDNGPTFDDVPFALSG